MAPRGAAHPPSTECLPPGQTLFVASWRASGLAVATQNLHSRASAPRQHRSSKIYRRGTSGRARRLLDLRKWRSHAGDRVSRRGCCSRLRGRGRQSTPIVVRRFSGMIAFIAGSNHAGGLAPPNEHLAVNPFLHVSTVPDFAGFSGRSVRWPQGVTPPPFARRAAPASPLDPLREGLDHQMLLPDAPIAAPRRHPLPSFCAAHTARRPASSRRRRRPSAAPSASARRSYGVSTASAIWSRRTSASARARRRAVFGLALHALQNGASDAVAATSRALPLGAEVLSLGAANETARRRRARAA